MMLMTKGGSSMTMRILALVLAILLSLTASPALSQEWYTDGDYTYVVAQGYAAITGYSGDDIDLVIPDTLGGYPVNRICRSAFQRSKTLVTVTVPEGVISVGESIPDENGYVKPLVEYDATPIAGFRCGTPVIRQARERSVFADCTSLTAVYLPDSVETIYKQAFSFCDARVYVNAGSKAERAWIEANATAVPVKPVRTPRHGEPTPEPEEDFRFGG